MQQLQRLPAAVFVGLLLLCFGSGPAGSQGIWEWMSWRRGGMSELAVEQIPYIISSIAADSAKRKSNYA